MTPNRVTKYQPTCMRYFNDRRDGWPIRRFYVWSFWLCFFLVCPGVTLFSFMPGGGLPQFRRGLGLAFTWDAPCSSRTGERGFFGFVPDVPLVEWPCASRNLAAAVYLGAVLICNWAVAYE